MMPFSKPKAYTYYNWLLALNEAGADRTPLRKPVDFRSLASMDYWRIYYDKGFSPTEALDQEQEDTEGRNGC